MGSPAQPDLLQKDSEPSDPHDAAQLLPLVYDELRRLAAHRLAKEPPGQTLQPTDEALTKLAATDRTAADLVQLRYFGGRSIPEAARILRISSRTANRLWTYARARLHQEIEGSEPAGKGNYPSEERGPFS